VKFPAESLPSPSYLPSLQADIEPLRGSCVLAHRSL